MTGPSTPGPSRGLYELMERYIDGDKSAFCRLHATLEPRLRGFLRTLVRDGAPCDDLLQLTLLKAHLGRERFALPAGLEARSRSPQADAAVQGWYFAIARNVAMDHLRDRYRAGGRVHGSALDDDDGVGRIPDSGPTAEELHVQDQTEREIVEAVRAAIARLPPSQREVVELHKLKGMSMAEIAERLQVREGAVRVRAHRAYRALARLLAPLALAWVGLGSGAGGW